MIMVFYIRCRGVALECRVLSVSGRLSEMPNHAPMTAVMTPVYITT